MTVKDVLKSASNMLSRQDVCAYLDGANQGGQDTLPTIGVMTSLLNLVVSELAGTFIPMVKCEEIDATDGKIYFTALTERCVNSFVTRPKRGRNKLRSHAGIYAIIRPKGGGRI